MVPQIRIKMVRFEKRDRLFDGSPLVNGELDKRLVEFF
jgi:hypothetical protein